MNDEHSLQPEVVTTPSSSQGNSEPLGLPFPEGMTTGAATSQGWKPVPLPPREPSAPRFPVQFAALTPVGQYSSLPPPPPGFSKMPPIHVSQIPAAPAFSHNFSAGNYLPFNPNSPTNSARPEGVEGGQEQTQVRKPVRKGRPPRLTASPNSPQQLPVAGPSAGAHPPFLHRKLEWSHEMELLLIKVVYFFEVQTSASDAMGERLDALKGPFKGRQHWRAVTVALQKRGFDVVTMQVQCKWKALKSTNTRFLETFIKSESGVSFEDCDEGREARREWLDAHPELQLNDSTRSRLINFSFFKEFNSLFGHGAAAVGNSLDPRMVFAGEPESFIESVVLVKEKLLSGHFANETDGADGEMDVDRLEAGDEGEEEEGKEVGDHLRRGGGRKRKFEGRRGTSMGVPSLGGGGTGGVFNTGSDSLVVVSKAIRDGLEGIRASLASELALRREVFEFDQQVRREELELKRQRLGLEREKLMMAREQAQLEQQRLEVERVRAETDAKRAEALLVLLTANSQRE